VCCKQTLSVTPSDLDLTNIVYHKSEILGIELVDHIVISNLSINSKTPLYYSHLENGAIYFVQNDMTHKSYKDIKPELEKIRKEFGADQKKEGEKNKAIEMAKSMLADNMDINIISKHTGLTIEEIKNIK